MSNKINLIYPINKKNYYIANYLFRKYDNTKLFCDSKSNLAYEDLSIIFNRCYTGIEINPLNEVNDYIYDNIFILDDTFDILNEFFEHIASIIFNRIYILKNIYILFSSHFSKIDINKINIIDDNSETKHGFYFDINVPVILVGGLYKMPDNIDIMIKLSEKFVEKKIKCYSIADDKNAQYVDNFENYYPSILNNETNFIDKVFKLNSQLENICSKHTPSIIILEYASALMRLDNNFIFNFSEFAYVIKEACEVDYFIANVSDTVNNEILSDIANDIKHKFNWDLYSAFISNQIYLWNDNYVIDSKVNLVSFSEDKIRRNLKKYEENSNVKVYDINIDIDMEEITNDIIKRLQ